MPLESAAPGRCQFRIGGLPVSITCRDHPLLEELNPEYRPFLVESCLASEDRISVELLVGDVPASPRGRLLFEAGKSWTLRELSGNFIIVPRGTEAGATPAWEAEICRRRRTVRVICGRELLVESAGVTCLASPFHYPLDQMVLMLALAGEGTIVHAAGVDIGGRGVILAGPSRAGKTTISRLCAAAKITVLSDDRVIVRRSGDRLLIAGSPWPGEGRFAANLNLPLSALVFLSKGNTDSVSPLAAAAAMKRLLPVLSTPLFDRGLTERAIDFCQDLTARCPVYELTFRPATSAVQALLETIRDIPEPR